MRWSKLDVEAAIYVREVAADADLHRITEAQALEGIEWAMREDLAPTPAAFAEHLDAARSDFAHGQDVLRVAFLVFTRRASSPAVLRELQAGAGQVDSPWVVMMDALPGTITHRAFALVDKSRQAS